MSKILFNRIQNISENSITVAGDTVTTGSFLYVCKNPKYFANYMSDLTSLYTQGLISIYDNANSTITSNNVWDSIDYNVQISNNPTVDTTNNPVVISVDTTLNGYENGIICVPNKTLEITLPAINTLTSYKATTIKNASSYPVNINTSGSDTFDGTATILTLNPFDATTIIPNAALSAWMKIVSTGSQGNQGAGSQGNQGYQGDCSVIYDAVATSEAEFVSALTSSTVISIYVKLPSGGEWTLGTAVPSVTLGSSKRIYGEAFYMNAVTLNLNTFTIRFRNDKIDVTTGATSITGTGQLYIKKINIQSGGTITGLAGTSYYENTTTPANVTNFTQQFWDNPIRTTTSIADGQVLAYSASTGAWTPTSSVTGSQGNQGNQGNQGASVTGSQGNQGNQGRQGNQGASVTGSQGNQGNQGNQGTGSQGNQGAQGAQGTGPIGNVSGTNVVTSIEVVSVIPDVGARVSGRLYFLIG